MASSTDDEKLRPIEKIHIHLFLELSNHIAPSLKTTWNKFIFYMRLHLSKELVECGDIFKICELLFQKGNISYGKYDALSNAFKEIGEMKCCDIVAKFTKEIHEAQIKLQNEILNQTLCTEENKPQGDAEETRANFNKETLYETQHAVQTDVEERSVEEKKVMETQKELQDIETDDSKLKQITKSIPDKERDDNTLKKRANSVSDEGDAANPIVGYHKMTDTVISFNDVKVHCKCGFDTSIGILKVNGSHSKSHGTCFRVGNGRHVMTVYHVVGDAINHMIQEIASRIQYSSRDPELIENVAKALKVNMKDITGKEVIDILRHHLNLSSHEISISKLLKQLRPAIPKGAFDKIMELLNNKLWKKACTVQFEEDSTNHSFEYDIPFFDEINDIAILKVIGKCKLPKPVLLNHQSDPQGQVIVFGYPGTDQLKIDIGCPVYSRREDLEKDIKKNIEFWMGQNLSEDRDYFAKGYEDKTENKTILHTSRSFVFGASGGPMTKVDQILNTPFVHMMYQGGIPNFYYEQGHRLYMYKSAPEHVRFEVGISMKKIAHLLKTSGKKDLLDEIFENVRYQEN